MAYSIPISTGGLVRIMEHHLEGYEWTVGAVGCIVAPAHERDHSWWEAAAPPPIKVGWWTVSVEHKTAKGGYAYATLPEAALAPHGCTEDCGKHLCQ